MAVLPLGLDLFRTTLHSGFFCLLNAIYVSRISGKLSFCHFGTEFFKFLGKNYLILSFFKLFLVKFLQITLFLGGLELSFWAKTEFFEILGI